MTALFVSALLILGALAAAILFGGPKALPPMAGINNPFKAVDFSDLPPPRDYAAADGASLYYRQYEPAVSARASPSPGSVVLVHGSSGSSNSMHLLAKAFAAAGYTVYALDIRGHGASGPKGRIGYIGQLEDDVESFMRKVSPPSPSTLAGFSSGGGFVLRFAGSARQGLFHDYLLLSPYLGQDAPTSPRTGNDWVSVGLPRLVGLSMLNAVGVTWFNDLPVLGFALSEEARRFLTPEYSYALAANFRPLADYRENIRAAARPCAAVAGVDDELFYTDKLESTFRALGKDWPVTLLSGVGHIALILDPAAVRAAVAAVDRMRKTGA